MDLLEGRIFELHAQLRAANERAERAEKERDDARRLIDNRIAVLREISADDKFPVFNAGCAVEIRALEDAKRLIDKAKLAASTPEAVGRGERGGAQQ